jgi:hypothetical protein
MTTSKKDSIFFAHSFEKTTPLWSNITDEDVANWFHKLLSRRWNVRSGKLAEAQPIADKVVDQLNEAKALFSVFTRRHKVDDSNDKYLPSPWLLTECAYARGLFRHHDYHAVAGFREKGIDLAALGMLASGGMEFPEFERENLERDKPRFNQYLDDLERRIQRGAPGQLALDPQYYHQTSLHKIYLVYRNGFGTVHNIVDIVIRDAERLMVDKQGKIDHRIWTHFGEIPAVSQMLSVPVHQRKNQAFFHGMLCTRNGRRMDTVLGIEETARQDSACQVGLRFFDKNRQPFKLKDNDVLRYQYAWGLPGMFPVNEEDMPEPTSAEKEYCMAELDPNHGIIDNVVLEVRFEREAHGFHKRELFDKSPFYRFGRGPLKRTEWTPAAATDVVHGDPDEFDIWYDRYLVRHKKLEKRLAIFWRPSSRRNQL